MPQAQSKAEHWRWRAEQARAAANDMWNAGAKTAMRQVAECYDMLAEQAEKLDASSGEQSKPS